MKPLLTISIPTYNRPVSLTRTVRTLLPQLNDRVTLIIKDNCSEPPVESYFTDEEKSHFTITRTKVNIGGAANIANAVYDADTKWVWTLGDDDYPKPDAVETVLSQIEKHPDALMFKFNSYFEKTVHSFEEMAEVNKYRGVFSNFLFMSSSVFNRDKLKDNLQDYYKFLSSMVGQTVFVLKYLEKKPDDVFFVKDCIIEQIVDFTKSQKKVVEGASWSYVTFIKRSSLIFDAFDDKRKMLNGTLFKGIVQQHLGTLLKDSMPFKQRVKYLRFLINKAGLINIVRYNSPTIGQFFLRIVLPAKIYKKLKERAIKNVLNQADNW